METIPELQPIVEEGTPVLSDRATELVQQIEQVLSATVQVTIWPSMCFSVSMVSCPWARPGHHVVYCDTFFGIAGSFATS